MKTEVSIKKNRRLIRIYENTNTESTSPRNKTRTTDIYCDIKWQKLYGSFSTPNALKSAPFCIYSPDTPYRFWNNKGRHVSISGDRHRLKIQLPYDHGHDPPPPIGTIGLMPALYQQIPQTSHFNHIGVMHYYVGSKLLTKNNACWEVLYVY